MRETRTFEQIRAHYEVERELADRLRRASKEERRGLYTSVYDEMFRRVPSHPALTQKCSPEEQQAESRKQLRFLAHFLKPDVTFLEIGPGDCAVAFEAARRVKEVYAVDVSDVITGGANRPDNFHLILSDGSNVPVPPTWSPRVSTSRSTRLRSCDGCFGESASLGGAEGRLIVFCEAFGNGNRGRRSALLSPRQRIINTTHRKHCEFFHEDGG